MANGNELLNISSVHVSLGNGTRVGVSSIRVPEKFRERYQRLGGEFVKLVEEIEKAR